MPKIKVYLADLTHTGQSIASNVFPLSVGLIGNYLKQEYPDRYDIELFKYPNDLSNALENNQPDVVGFSNYSWNCDISYQFTKLIKKNSPDTVVIWGGPNYGLTHGELLEFWAEYSLIDFYIIKEGEVAMLNLLKQLEEYDFDVQKFKQSGIVPSNAHFLRNGTGVYSADVLPRIKRLSDIGSPYLSGMMDKFFDNLLIPMVHTTRGCPFGCTFCTEGNSYYNRVSQVNNFKEELEYIAKRRKNIQDLLITDANFGMFPQDLEKADAIAEVKSTYSWPSKILVSTGKNKKERVIEVAKKLDGALSIAASLQTTDEQILSTIKRANISSEALNVIVQESKDANSPTYTEIILGLPGDSVATHIASLKEVINSGLGIVRMYQLILLPQTELATPESRAKHGMQTVYRINPRCFGLYSCYNEEFCSVEYEEICVTTNTLSRIDYLYCRQLNLSVEILHNSGVFYELRNLLVYFEIDWFDFIENTHNSILAKNNKLTAIYKDFEYDCFANTFESKEQLQLHFNTHYKDILSNTAGTNEMAKGKARAIFEAINELHEIAYDEAEQMLSGKGCCDENILLYLEQLKLVSLARKSNLFDFNPLTIEQCRFNFCELEKVKYDCNPLDFLAPSGISLCIEHEDQDKQLVQSYLNQYGNKIEGLGRILMRANTENLFKSTRLLQ
ncbi:B12-binding domain-containing radical SAM protein [Catenovulum sediminis]|uniref:Cobalamin-dependent protein n=1 Tax=Catenovulum sediminis TaxID=1740262 RepID=A0ABV1RHS4_9ALTE